MKDFIVEVKHKQTFSDPLGIAAEKDAKEAGFKNLGTMRVGQLYKIAGLLNAGNIQAVAQKLLTDPVTQEFHIHEADMPASASKNMRRIEVWFHPCVTDTVGETVKIGINDLGIKNVSSVSTGTSYIFKKDIPKKTRERLARNVLANSMIQHVNI